MHSLEQIEMMNADEELKAAVKRYGWAGGKRVRKLEDALSGLLTVVTKAAAAAETASNSIVLPEPHDLRSLSLFLQSGHDAAKEILGK